MKKALLLCASHNDLGLIRALHKLNYEIIVSGNIPNLIGQKYCDKYIQADYSDKELILEIAQKNGINAILQCCNDFGVYTASYVAEKLGLPGYDSYETTLKLHNKDKFKHLAKELNLDCPLSESFTKKEKALEFVSKTNFPLIIKPTDASAGNGISKVNDLDEAKRAIDFAFEKSRLGVIVIEPFIQGEQGGFCTFLIDKKVRAICSNNEYSVLNPYRVEIDTFPAKRLEKFKDRLIEQIEFIARQLDLCDGIFHLQYIYDGEKAYIIEVMRRILGNMYHVPGNLSTNMDWEYWETRARCGLDLSLFPQNISQTNYFAYKAILADSNGIIKSISVPKDKDTSIIDVILLKEAGDIIKNHKSEPIGFCFYSFADEKEMDEALIKNYNNAMVQIVPQ